MTDNVTYFDLDAVAQEKVVIKLGGSEYPLVPVTVDSFVANTRLISKLETIDQTDIEAQLQFTKELLKQAFPTMTDAVLGAMTMIQLNKLVDLAHGMNGQKEATAKVEAEVAASNPPIAG
jgi:hypothetical protein